jgi:hypothetical protein
MLMIEPTRIYYRIDHPSSRSVAVFDRAFWATAGGPRRAGATSLI